MLARSHQGIAALAVAGIGACAGGSSKQVQLLAPPPPPSTVATLAGPLCSGQVCQCRDTAAPGDGGAGAPDDPAVKRFEIRLGPSEHELWLTVDGDVLYKGLARAEDCFYVDLGAGDHKLALRASNAGGVSAGVTVREYAPTTSSWYDTFAFACGTPGVCSYDELSEYKASLAKYARDIHDPCGSVKVKGLVWDTDVAPDQQHPGNLAVALTLDVYRFTPKHPHGDPACANRFE